MVMIKRLVQSEMLKLFHRKSTLVMIFTLLVLVFLTVIFDRINTPYDSNYWGAVAGQAGLLFLVIIFSIAIAGGIMANEFAWGTIKLLLIRPANRSKILLTKYLTLIIFIIVLMTILLASAMFFHGILFIFTRHGIVLPENPGTKIVFDFSFPKLIFLYLLMFVEVLTYATIAFTLSAITKSNALSTGVTFFTMLLGPQLAMFIAEKPWSKYFLFSHTQLTQYLKSLDLNNLGFSLMIIVLYLAVFYWAGWTVFVKRDILK